MPCRATEDMNIRGLCEKTQKAHIRNVKHFASFLGRSPDTATPEDLRSYQLKMTEEGVTASTFNVRIMSLRFFFGVTCGRDEMKRFMQFHRNRFWYDGGGFLLSRRRSASPGGKQSQQ